MKKGNLLVLTVPAMLLAASCGAGVNQKTSAVKAASENDGDVTVTIVCVNCLVTNPIDSKQTNVLVGKFTTDKEMTFPVAADPEDPNALLPDYSNVDFRVGGEKSYIHTFQPDESHKNANLIFKVPDQDVSVVIDATVQCVDFVVNIPDTSSGHSEIEFGFNGAINHVNWGDGTINNESNHKYEIAGNQYVRVYGKLSSIWFTEKDEPTSNSTLLKPGNEFINTFTIHHSVRTLPNYALNGCTNLANAYIGGSVQTIGKKALQLENVEARGATIYCYPTSKPDGWDEEWVNADCPVCYGMVDPKEAEKDHTDKDNGFSFKIIKIETGRTGRTKSVAMITNVNKKPAELSEGLIIPANVADGNKYEVHSIAPFAFRHLGSDFKAPIAFDTGSAVTEIGDYAFAELSATTQIDFSNIRSTSTVRIGKSAFRHTGATGIVFPHYTEEYEGKAPDLIIDDEAFFDASNIKSIVIPADSFKLKEIHKAAFQDCYGLGSFVCEGEDTNFPTSVTKIGDMAFANCKELLSAMNPTITITTNVTEMGEFVFLEAYEDSSIRVAYEEGKTPEGWSENWNRISIKEDKRITVSWGFVKEIADTNGCIYEITKKNDIETATLVRYKGAKSNPTEVDIVIPEYVTDPEVTTKKYQVVAIAANVFSGYKEIVSATVPKSVTKVGRHAFGSCSPKLKVFYGGSDEDVKNGWDVEWTFPNIGSLDVGAALYTNYDGTVPQTELEEGSQFDLVREVTPKNDAYNASILKYIQDATNKVTIPGTISDAKGKNTYNVTSIGGKSFMGADLTAGLDFAKDNKLTSIGAGAFATAKLPSEISLPSGIKDVGCGAFAQAGGVTSIDFASTAIKSIPLGAFVMAPDLTTVTLPDGVSVGEYAFTYCTSLKGVDLSKATMDIVPERLFAMCTSYKGKLDENGQPTGDLQLPLGITSIGSSVFAGSGVEKVILSKNAALEFIADNAFAGCASLTSVMLPSSCKGFGDNVFGPMKETGATCSKLTEIDLSAITTELIKIPGSFFGGDTDNLPDAFKKGGKGVIYVPSAFVTGYQKAFEAVLGADNLDHIVAK